MMLSLVTTAPHLSTGRLLSFCAVAPPGLCHLYPTSAPSRIVSRISRDPGHCFILGVRGALTRERVTHGHPDHPSSGVQNLGPRDCRFITQTGDVPAGRRCQQFVQGSVAVWPQTINVRRGATRCGVVGAVQATSRALNRCRQRLSVAGDARREASATRCASPAPVATCVGAQARPGEGSRRARRPSAPGPAATRPRSSRVPSSRSRAQG